MLELRGVTKLYSGIPAVRDVTFTARAGEVTGYLGPNGSGKSTTLKMITGLIEPSAGQILFNGEPISPVADALVARWRPARSAKIGDAVFAVGNPHGLGWSHTTGTISQFRLQDHGGTKLRVIQTQTAVNPGNSGGGLYAAADGSLIGIVTWKQDERTGEGLNFAISLDALTDLLPADFQPEPAAR